MKQGIASPPNQSALFSFTCSIATYSSRVGEVHPDKAVVWCFVVSLNDELVSLIGNVLSEVKTERDKEWREWRRQKDVERRGTD